MLPVLVLWGVADAAEDVELGDLAHRALDLGEARETGEGRDGVEGSSNLCIPPKLKDVNSGRYAFESCVMNKQVQA